MAGFRGRAVNLFFVKDVLRRTHLAPPSGEPRLVRRKSSFGSQNRKCAVFQTLTSTQSYASKRGMAGSVLRSKMRSLRIGKAEESKGEEKPWFVLSFCSAHEQSCKYEIGKYGVFESIGLHNRPSGVQKKWRVAFHA